MNSPNHTSRLHLLAGQTAAATLLAMALSACGGGGGTESKTADTPTTVTFADAVTDDTGATVSGAKVALATTTGTSESTSSTDGSYSITVKRAALPTSGSSTTVYLTISGSAAYQPLTVSYDPATITAGNTYKLSNGATSGSTYRLHKLTAAEFTPSGSDANLTRLGDGVASGEANQGFQITSGTFAKSTTIKLGDLAKLGVASGVAAESAYPTVTLSIDFRGMEAGTCADKVTLFQSNSPTGVTQDGFKQVFDSTTTPKLTSTGVGSLSTWTPGAISTTGLTPNATSAALWVTIESGTCTASDGSSSGYDDFEFANIRAVFNPAN